MSGEKFRNNFESFVLKKNSAKFVTSFLFTDPFGLRTNLSQNENISEILHRLIGLYKYHLRGLTASLTPSERPCPDKQHHNNNRHKKRGGQQWFFRYTTEHSGRAHTVSLVLVPLSHHMLHNKSASVLHLNITLRTVNKTVFSLMRTQLCKKSRLQLKCKQPCILNIF